jgi:mRNA interferase RelE/StbE
MSRIYTVIIQQSVQKQIVRLPAIYLNKIRTVILSLEINPRPAGAIKLKGSKNKYRIRVGTYRIVYEIQDDILTIYIFDVDHRKDIYRYR